MAEGIGTFRISFADQPGSAKTVSKDGIYIGRLNTCELVLDDPAVSRIHASLQFQDNRYNLVNISSANVLTLNGRVLRPQRSDVVADGDVVQIGPFTIAIERKGDAIALTAKRQVETRGTVPVKPAVPAPKAVSMDVLKVFWEKRSRQKEDWGTRLRPTEKPRPGKAMFNWRPTRDLRRPWRMAFFIWAILIFGAIGAFAYFRHPQAYEPKALSSPHAKIVESSPIAVRSNGNSCTTCHTPNEPIENSCVRCHEGEQFHSSNTKAHQEAGITCTVCHKEHEGPDFDITATAVQSCAQCHNDNNKATYNGKSVHTPHNGSYGYPVVNGVWQWKGVYKEVADAIPEIKSSATGDRDEQAKLSREFHTIHVARLKTPDGLKGDVRGQVSCSTCHNSFKPLDTVTPRRTCAACHTTPEGASGRDMRFGVGGANCISCHVQHPYSTRRWSEFLTDDALERRNQTIENQIKNIPPQ